MEQRLILAAGEHTRFHALIPKQLCKVGSETLIHRQDRQFGFCTLVTKNDVLVKSFSPVFKPHEVETVLHTIKSCLRYYTVDLLFLLGDVYYSDAAARLINDDKPGLHFYLNMYEVFAFRVNMSHREQVLNAIEFILSRQSEINHVKIWTLYRFLNGQKDLNEHNLFERMTTQINDTTQDFDTCQEFEDFKHHISKYK